MLWWSKKKSRPLEHTPDTFSPPDYDSGILSYLDFGIPGVCFDGVWTGIFLELGIQVPGVFDA